MTTLEALQARLARTGCNRVTVATTDGIVRDLVILHVLDDGLETAGTVDFVPLHAIVWIGPAGGRA